MTALVRNFYINTGLQGSPIKPNKPKLSVAFTAVRNEQGEQVVQFGVASCHPVDHNQFKRSTGFQIAKTRLALVQNGVPADFNSPEVLMSIGSVTFPSDVELDKIPELIVKQYEYQVRQVKKAKWSLVADANKKLEAARKVIDDAYAVVRKSPEVIAAKKAYDEALEVIYEAEFSEDQF